MGADGVVANAAKRVQIVSGKIYVNFTLRSLLGA